MEEAASEEIRKTLEPEATRLFGSGSWNGVWKVIGRYQPPANQSAIRIYRAILKLSEGKIDLLQHYTTQAIEDFRDVLYWAELQLLR